MIDKRQKARLLEAGRLLKTSLKKMNNEKQLLKITPAKEVLHEL